MSQSQNKAGGVTTFEDFENYKNEEEEEFVLNQNQFQQNQQSFGLPEGSDSNQKMFLEQIENTNKRKLNIEQLFQQQEEFNQNLNQQSNSKFQQFSKSAGQNICLLHNEELGDVFCLTCNSLNLCLQCVCKGEHQSHQIMNVKKAQEMAVLKLEQYKKLLEEKKSLVDSFQEQICLEKENLHQTGEQNKNYINKKFTEYHQMLDEKHQQLLQDFDKTMRLKNDRISFAINNINTQLQIYSNYLNEIEKILQGSQYNNGGQQMINFYTENNDVLDHTIKQQIQDQFEKEMVHLTESQVDIFLNDKQLRDNIQFMQLQIHENYSDYLAYKKIFTNKLQQSQNNFLQSSASQQQLLQQQQQSQQQASNSSSKFNNNINANNSKQPVSKIDNINAYIYQSQKKLQNMERQNLLAQEINLTKVLDSKKKQVAVIKAEISQQLTGFNFKFDADQQFFEKEPGKGGNGAGEEVAIEEKDDLESFKKDINQGQQKLQQQQQKSEKPLEEIQLNFQKESQQQSKQQKFNQSGYSQKSNPPQKTSFLDYSSVSKHDKNTADKSQISLLEFRKKHLQNSQLINYQSQSGGMGQATTNVPDYLSTATYTKKQLTSNYQNSRLQSLSKKLEKSMKDDRNISSSLNISQSNSFTQKKNKTKDQLMNELGNFGAGGAANKNSYRNKIGLAGTFALFPSRNPNPVSGRDFQYNNKFSTTDKLKKSFF